MNFEGRSAIVTGGARGIGFEIASQLAASGASVAIADNNAEGAQAAAETVGGGGRVLPIVVDVTDPDQVTGMVTQAAAALGAVDILIHSAGVGVEAPFLETTVEDWRRVIEIDLTGTFLCGQAAAREMVKRGYGRIVNLSSAAGVRGGGRRAAYGAAKGGVNTLTQVMANELAPHGVTVNALAPGAIETDLVKKMHTAATRQIYKAATPMRRYGTPPETAAAALFLASEEAAYITGQILGVDGGFLAAGLIFPEP